MLPVEFHDLAAVMEISPETWRRIFELAEPNRSLSSLPAHSEILEILTKEALKDELLEALEIVVELGTETGRDTVNQAAQDLGLNLDTNPDMPAREFIAKTWIISASDRTVRSVLVRARLHPRDSNSRRHYREYVGEGCSGHCQIDLKSFQGELQQWVNDNGYNCNIEMHSYKIGSEDRIDILRSDNAKRVAEFKNGMPGVLDFIPALSDHIRFDASINRIGIASRSAKFIKLYRELLGKIISGKEDFFSSESICTLKPLQKYGVELFDDILIPSINRVEVSEVLWRRGDKDRIWVKSNNCFKTISDIGGNLLEGELIEAKLVIYFSRGRKGTALIKVPNKIEINAGCEEGIVEQLLDSVGIRGAFGDDQEEQPTFWQLYPWRQTEKVWRSFLGLDFDRLVREQGFKRIRLVTTTHPDHPDATGQMDVHVLEDGSLIGASTDPAIPIRTLTESDVQGYELDVDRMLNELRRSMALEGAVRELNQGLVEIGRRELIPSISVCVFIATRKPGAGALAQVRDAAKGCTPVLIVPRSCCGGIGIPEVEVNLPIGPFGHVLGRVVETLDLRSVVPLPVWLDGRVDLLVDIPRGVTWFRSVDLSELAPGTHPYKFLLELARAKGRLVQKEHLQKVLSSTLDEGVVRTAKSDAMKAMKESYRRAGRDPKEIDAVFQTKNGGYAFVPTSYILE